MTLKEYLKSREIDQIADDEEFCEEEYNAIKEYCCNHTLTENDAKEIESRGYQRYQFE